MIYSEKIKFANHQFVQPWTYHFYITNEDSALTPSITDVRDWCKKQPSHYKFGFTNRIEDTLWWFQDKNDALLFAIRFGFKSI